MAEGPVGCSQILQEGKDGGLDQGGVSRDGAKWIDTSYVLEEDALKTCIVYTVIYEILLCNIDNCAHMYFAFTTPRS